MTFKGGDWIEHTSFGSGLITEDCDPYFLIRFVSGTEKKLKRDLSSRRATLLIQNSSSLNRNVPRLWAQKRPRNRIPPVSHSSIFRSESSPFSLEDLMTQNLMLMNANSRRLP